jgi:hypothetical protein
MTSMSKIESNRRNACRSTGPRTAAGRLKSSRNALRHGLSSLRRPDPAAGEAVRNLAASLCRPNEVPGQVVNAYTLAEAEVMLERVRKAVAMAVDQLVTALDEGDDTDMSFVGAQTSRLWILDRYERQALKGRNRAIAAFLNGRSFYKDAPTRLRFRPQP